MRHSTAPSHHAGATRNATEDDIAHAKAVADLIPPYVSPDAWQPWDDAEPCPVGFTCTQLGNATLGAFSCDEMARIAREVFGLGDVLAGTYCPEGEVGLVNCDRGGYCPDMVSPPRGFAAGGGFARAECLARGAPRNNCTKTGEFGRMVFASRHSSLSLTLSRRWRRGAGGSEKIPAQCFDDMTVEKRMGYRPFCSLRAVHYPWAK